MQRGYTNVARLAKTFAQSRQADTENLGCEGGGSITDEIRPARPKRDRGTRKRATTDHAKDEAEFQKRVEAAVIESLKNKNRRKKASATKDKSFKSTAFTSSGSAV